MHRSAYVSRNRADVVSGWLLRANPTLLPDTTGKSVDLSPVQIRRWPASLCMVLHIVPFPSVGWRQGGVLQITLKVFPDVNIQLRVAIVQEPVDPSPEAGYALLRKQTVGTTQEDEWNYAYSISNGLSRAGT